MKALLDEVPIREDNSFRNNKLKLLYVSPEELKPFIIEKSLTDREIIELIKDEKSPRWPEWECQHCPHQQICNKDNYKHRK